MIARLACLFLAAVLALPVAAQTFPSKTVRIIVVYPPGGTSDAVTRLLAEKLALPSVPTMTELGYRASSGSAR